MSKPVTNKIVKRIKESELVDLMDRILENALEAKKAEWLKEQAEKEVSKTNILETKVAKLEAQFKKLTENKK